MKKNNLVEFLTKGTDIFHIILSIGLLILAYRVIHHTIDELKNGSYMNQNRYFLILQFIGNLFVSFFSFHFKIYALFIVNVVSMMQSIIFLYKINKNNKDLQTNQS